VSPCFDLLTFVARPGLIHPRFAMADSETSSLQGGRSRRAWTVSAESEAMEGSGRSNGRSSIDSTAERPKTQAGEGPDSAKAGSSGISKLTEFDLQESRSNDSRDSNSAMTSSNNSSVPPEGDVVNLLTDDSEPDRYAVYPRNIWTYD
jgi:hypothetical protein